MQPNSSIPFRGQNAEKANSYIKSESGATSYLISLILSTNVMVEMCEVDKN